MSESEPGTVYIGRIPHGFYEDEMRQYFSQFGTVTKLRLSRNRKTGHSKHFAFVEFESQRVAKIVAETMDNYLMYGHILKCKYLQPESLHPDIFKGANKRFRVAPHNKMEKRALEAPKTESHWAKKNQKEQTKRERKAEKLKEMGYDIELPKLKNPSDILHKEQSQITDEEQGLQSSKADDKEVPTSIAVPKDEVALKKSKEEREEKTAIDETSEGPFPAADSDVNPSNSTQSQSGVDQKSEKRDKRRQKPKKAKNDTQLATQPMADWVAPKARKEMQRQSEKPAVPVTTATSESARIGKSSAETKKDKHGAAHSAAEEEPAQVTKKPQVVAGEKETRPSMVSLERVKDEVSKSKSGKRKGSGADDVFAGPESNPNRAAVMTTKRRKVDGGPTPKSILKRAKKA